MPFPNFEQMSRAEDERAAELYAIGYSQPEVAAALGRSRKAVRNALNRMGVQVRSSQDGFRETLARNGGRRIRKPVNSVFALGYLPTLSSSRNGDVHG